MLLDLMKTLWCDAGLIPMLAAPTAGADDTLLSQVLSLAVKRGLVKAKQHVVCVLSVRGDLVLNVCQVDDRGAGLQSNLASLGAPAHCLPAPPLCTGSSSGPCSLSTAQHSIPSVV